jgi:hypothetical protein
MGDIYGQAAATVIWLGEEAEDSQVALEWLRSLSQIDIGELDRKTNAEKDQLWDKRAYLAFTRLQERPYWRRRWIYQEAVLSAKPFIMCGSRILSFDEYDGGTVRLDVLVGERNRKALPTTFTDFEPLKTIALLRRRVARGGSSRTSLLEVLAKLHRAASGRPHDRVYALLALCGRAEAQGIPINYKLPLETLFMEVVANHVRIHGGKNLDVLCCAKVAARMQRDGVPYTVNYVRINAENPAFARGEYLPDLPSWAPNWTSPFAVWEFGPDSLAGEEDEDENSGAAALDRSSSSTWEPVFRASGDLPSDLPNLGRAVAERALEARGVEVDRVARALVNWSPMPPGQQRDKNSPRFAEYWDFCCEVPVLGELSSRGLVDVDPLLRPLPTPRSSSSSASPYPSASARLTAFFRTITGGGRLLGPRAVATDRYLRHQCAAFFEGTVFGRRLVSEGLLGPDDFIRPAVSECYTDPRYNSAGYMFLTFDKLCSNRLYTTERGRLGLGPPQTMPGQHICVLFGCSSPLVLKETGAASGSSGAKPEWLVQGEAYVDGYMFGEAVEMERRREVRDQIFRLV